MAAHTTSFPKSQNADLDPSSARHVERRARPIAPIPLAMLTRVERRIAGDANLDGPAPRRRVNAGTVLTPAFDDVRFRKPPPVAVPSGYDRNLRRERCHERPGGRGAAAVMRDDDDVGWRHTASQDRPFPTRLHVSRQECGTRAARYPQDAARIIVRCRELVRGMQHVEAHSIPYPSVTPRADMGVRDRRCDGWPETDALDSAPFEQRLESTTMIEVTMAHHQKVDLADASCSQVRQYRELGRISAALEGGPRVVDERVMLRAHDDRQSLSHIEHAHFEIAVGGRRARHEEDVRTACEPKQADRPDQR